MAGSPESRTTTTTSRATTTARSLTTARSRITGTTSITASPRTASSPGNYGYADVPHGREAALDYAKGYAG